MKQTDQCDFTKIFRLLHNILFKKTQSTMKIKFDLAVNHRHSNQTSQQHLPSNPILCPTKQLQFQNKYQQKIITTTAQKCPFPTILFRSDQPTSKQLDHNDHLYFSRKSYEDFQGVSHAFPLTVHRPTVLSSRIEGSKKFIPKVTFAYLKQVRPSKLEKYYSNGRKIQKCAICRLKNTIEEFKRNIEVKAKSRSLSPTKELRSTKNTDFHRTTNSSLSSCLQFMIAPQENKIIKQGQQQVKQETIEEQLENELQNFFEEEDSKQNLQREVQKELDQILQL